MIKTTEVNIITIETAKPNNNHLTNYQIDYIKNVLEKSLPTGSNVCISRSKLFESIKDILGLNIEQYQFERAITTAIREKKIEGFATKHGRNGGICRLDALTKVKLKNLKTCTVTIQNILYFVKASETQMLTLISELGGTPSQNDDSIYINNKAYKLPASIDSFKMLKTIINILYGAKRLSDNKSVEINTAMEKHDCVY